MAGQITYQGLLAKIVDYSFMFAMGFGAMGIGQSAYSMNLVTPEPQRLSSSSPVSNSVYDQSFALNTDQATKRNFRVISKLSGLKGGHRSVAIYESGPGDNIEHKIIEMVDLSRDIESCFSRGSVRENSGKLDMVAFFDSDRTVYEFEDNDHVVLVNGLRIDYRKGNEQERIAIMAAEEDVENRYLPAFQQILVGIFYQTRACAVSEDIDEEENGRVTKLMHSAISELVNARDSLVRKSASMR